MSRNFLFKLAPLVASAFLLSACGASAQMLGAPQHQAYQLKAKKAPALSGCYLALELEGTPAMLQEAARLRSELGFVDMGKAKPARDPNEFHVTVGYFQTLPAEKVSELSAKFAGVHGQVLIDGYGVANRQAAYFTVKGIEEARAYLQALKLRYEGDDPHVTFGVCPANPCDVHNVPKKAQKPVAPIPVRAEFHLMQGSKKIW